RGYLRHRSALPHHHTLEKTPPADYGTRSNAREYLKPACGASPPSHSREDAPLRLRHPLLRREYLKSACGASLGVIAVGGLDPREHLAQFLTRGLDRVGLLIGAELLELRGAGVLIVDEPLRSE